MLTTAIIKMRLSEEKREVVIFNSHLYQLLLKQKNTLFAACRQRIFLFINGYSYKSEIKKTRCAHQRLSIRFPITPHRPSSKHYHKAK